MRYCPSCFDEYRDEVNECGNCNVALVSLQELEKLPAFRRKEGIVTSEFVRVAAAEDPFDAESLCDALESEKVPVLARARRPVEVFPTGETRPWWEILVPEDFLAKAKPIVEKRQKELRAAEADAAEAAEEEAGEAASKARER